MRSFTRLTDTFSKKLDNHIHTLAIHFVFHNFCRIDNTLRASPAVAVAVTDMPWSLEDILAKIEAISPEPKASGFYRKREGG